MGYALAFLCICCRNVATYTAFARIYETLTGAQILEAEGGTLSNLEIGLYSFPILLILIFLRVPID